jgi:hypothetical protein
MEYWQTYTCDGCGKPFTLEEWDARETPHHTDCPNYDLDDDALGDEGFTECTCDRNFHSHCFNFDSDPEMDAQQKAANDIERYLRS